MLASLEAVILFELSCSTESRVFTEGHLRKNVQETNTFLVEKR